MRKVNMIELIQVVSILLFVILISIYHISFDGYLGISEKNWAVVWAIAENGLLLTLSFIVVSRSIGIVRIICRWILTPYFILKLIYHLSCFSGIYLFSIKTWMNFWSFVLVGLIITTLIACINLIYRKDVA